MGKKSKCPELLSPAGNFEKMKAALLYGADAVYLAGTRFGMRSAADNFTDEELERAVRYAHERGKKVYLTMNTLPHGNEYPALREFLCRIKNYGIDAMIVADLGVLATIRELIPEMEIHISTQAGIVSPQSACAFAALGAKRLVLARELTLDEIRAIREALPPETELETFIHGSMCVSFSGRCMLSQNLTGRDANRGACTQPCRWTYTVVEEKRPNEPYPIEQNDLGTFIMSSKDMCTVGILPQLIEAGIDSFKIEGRMKSAYYTAVVTNSYRMAIDSYTADPEGYRFDHALQRELESVSHREYCTGYYLDSPMENAQLSAMNGYIREKAYFATALEPSEHPLPIGMTEENDRGRLYPFVQRNKVSVGERAELISPGRIGRPFLVEELYDETGSPVPSAPHPSMRFFARVPFEVQPGDIMRSGESDVSDPTKGT
ncbi:MAG: U32 family peptidase [Clostridia bacterium]|nr:U32 family peptidase [Clostridia bacterium]